MNFSLVLFLLFASLVQSSSSIFGTLDCGQNDHREDLENKLYIACFNVDHERTKVLLQQGARFNPQFKKVNEAYLMNAVTAGHVEIAEALLSHAHVDVNAVIQEVPVLLAAAVNRHPRMIEFLLQQDGIDVNVNFDGGRTTLMGAASNNLVEIIALLLAHKNIDVNYADNNGFTALMYAAASGHVEAVASLLKHKLIKTELLYNESLTAQSIASLNGHLQVANLIRNHFPISFDNEADDDILQQLWCMWYL